MTDGGAQLSKFKGAIIALAERVQAVDIRAYESMPPERLAAELQPIVAQLLSIATGLVAEILAAYEGVAEEPAPKGEPIEALASPYLPFEQAIDAAIGAQTGASAQAVGDIAFLAQLELRQRAERLERVTACKSTIAIVGECDSALRRIRKVLTSIDVALARAGLADKTLDFESEVEVSLRVRRACAKLRKRVLAGGDPTASTLYARLRGAGTAIAMLVGWEVYPSVRVRDRLQLRDLQRRILDWLREGRDEVAGMRLWQDLVGFIRMLSQVNRRQELVDHDSRIVRAARGQLAAGAEIVPSELLVSLATLEGLDDEIDALLTSEARSSAEAWRSALSRVSRQLGVTEGA